MLKELIVSKSFEKQSKIKEEQKYSILSLQNNLHKRGIKAEWYSY